MRTILFPLVMLLLTSCATAPREDNFTRKEPDRAAALNVQLGIEYMKRGNNEVALRKLKHALELDPGYAEAHNILGVLYARLGETDKAEQHYRQSVRLAPKAPRLLNNYALFLCQQGRVEEAEKLFSQALDNPLYTTPEVALTNAGICHLDHGESAKGEAYLQRALAINPEFPPALLQMARLLAGEGRFRDAQGYLERYRKTKAPQGPDFLRLGIRVARGAGDERQAARYERMLRSISPRPETGPSVDGSPP